MSPVEMAMMDTAMNMITPVKMRPMGVIGTRSPYPTVLRVSTANHRASKKERNFSGLGIVLRNVNAQGRDVQHKQDHGKEQEELIPDQVKGLFKAGCGLIKPGQLENGQHTDNPQGIKNLPVRPEKHAQERHADNEIQNAHAAEDISLPRLGAQHPQDILKHKEIADPVIHLGRNPAYQRMNVRNGIQRVQHEPYQNQHPDDVLPGAEIGCALLGAGNQGHGGNQE